jgi:hypothetical protein
MSHAEENYVVSFDERGAAVLRPDGIEEKVAWADLVKVTVEATAGEAADAPAHVWILWGRDNRSGCVYPGGATGAELLLVEMQQRLANFDLGAVAKALKSDENQTWLLWQSDEGTNTPDDDGPHLVN